MKIEAFGEALIKTGDLDPVYIAIVGAGLSQDQLHRLLLAYWCFYHLGAAAWLSEQDKFWTNMLIAAENKKPSPLGGRWPRSAERRHFRGERCVEAITYLLHFHPRNLFTMLTRTRSVGEVMKIMEAWPLFGPWIIFKAADMLERCMGVPISFPEDLCFIYKEPRAALDLLSNDPKGEMTRLLSVFSRLKAPPTYDRSCGVQEVESVLCKWKSHTKGHYWIGKDIHEVRQGLKGWGTTANKLLENCPKEVTCILGRVQYS